MGPNHGTSAGGDVSFEKKSVFVNIWISNVDVTFLKRRNKRDGYLVSEECSDDDHPGDKKRIKKTTDGNRRVQSCESPSKDNLRNKSADPAVLITDKFIYKLDSKKFNNKKSAIPFTDLTGVSISSLTDQLVIINLRGGNDYVFALTGPTK
ncbi:Unconventional myosin-Ia [Chamberlinius hualienensis]